MLGTRDLRNCWQLLQGAVVLTGSSRLCFEQPCNQVFVAPAHQLQLTLHLLAAYQLLRVLESVAGGDCTVGMVGTIGASPPVAAAARAGFPPTETAHWLAAVAGAMLGVASRSRGGEGEGGRLHDLLNNGY